MAEEISGRAAKCIVAGGEMKNRVSNWWLKEREERLHKGGWRRWDGWELSLVAERKGFICWLIRKQNRGFI